MYTNTSTQPRSKAPPPPPPPPTTITTTTTTPLTNKICRVSGKGKTIPAHATTRLSPQPPPPLAPQQYPPW
ncbi:hypothetical protein E2C01_091832 [Portunus trituberculatus]|uniref:Uncharacterized protein n=1 Tax=Portunus trituberculatus TaxID=210409 RepID=A0A5B7JU07_PORTR|nr:hypothetical protein [Portunus trituberculatus]